MNMNFEHLVLLIGTNPLPNYVVAKYFLEKNKKEQNKKLKAIWAIHSGDTLEVARRLHTVLEKELNGVKLELVGLKEQGDAAAIRDDIGRLIKLKANEAFHLNYTGGTKNMAVQTYRKFYTDYTNVDFSNSSFSYLDAKDFLLKDDHGKSISDGDLRKTISIDLNDLLELHECIFKRKDKWLDWKQANEIITGFIKKDMLGDFLEWKNDIIRPFFYRDGNPVKPVVPILENLKKHPFHEQAMRLIDAFPEDQQWKFDSNGCLDVPEAKWRRGIKYLDGPWLEYHVKELLEAKANAEGLDFKIEGNMHIIKGKIEIAGKVDEEIYAEMIKKHVDFEVDILLLYGYQLLGISITTAFDRPRCKNKAFEILHRSQQIGGDEARAVFITTLNGKAVRNLVKDLRKDTGDKERLSILGLDDLHPKTLWDHIEKLTTGAVK